MTNRKTDRKSPIRYKQPPVTWAEAVRDVVIRSMDRGLFVPLMLSSFVLLSIFRMDAAQLSELYLELFDKFVGTCAVGWTLFGGSVCFGVALGFISRSKTRKEEHRIGSEKSKLQEQAVDRKLSTSRRH